MDDVTPVDSLLASSSSGITPSIIQSKCKHPERVVIGHPFNPPHIIPLVEIVGGTKTPPDAVQQAMAFYAAIGKKPIHLKKELPGHVANRFQAALYREMLISFKRTCSASRTRMRPLAMDQGFVGARWVKACNGIWAAARAASNTSWSTSWIRYKA